jgi:glucose-1-phosphate thymidylyltransferase
LSVKLMGRGYAWFDTGTHDALLNAAAFIQTMQDRQGILVSSPEEIAWRYGWITTEQLLGLAHALSKTTYGEALLAVLDTGIGGSMTNILKRPA